MSGNMCSAEQTEPEEQTTIPI
ncbi:unnamed protein product, partial [Rotaria sordida]